MERVLETIVERSRPELEEAKRHVPASELRRRIAAEPRRETAEIRVEPEYLIDAPSVERLRPLREAGRQRLEKRRAADETDPVRATPRTGLVYIVGVLPDIAAPEVAVRHMRPP